MVNSGKFSVTWTDVPRPWRIAIAGSPARENGRALLDKRPGCLPVVLGAAGLDLARGFLMRVLGQTASPLGG